MLEGKYKNGDRVRRILTDSCDGFNIGDTGIVVKSEQYYYCSVKLDKNGLINSGNNEDNLELIERKINMLKKEDLKNGDIVTLRNGDKLRVYDDDQFSQEQEEYDNDVDGFFEYDDNLIYIYNDDSEEYDIVKVERVSEYEVVFERQEEKVKEMTVSEISKKLGYEIKIVKEK